MKVITYVTKNLFLKLEFHNISYNGVVNIQVQTTFRVWKCTNRI